MARIKTATPQTLTVRSYSFRVVLEKDDDVYLATVPALAGCHSWGYTVEEALHNVQDAVETYIEDLKKHREPIPSEPTTDVIVFSEPRVTVTV